MTDEMEEFRQEFLVESRENIERAEQDLIALERDPNAHERVASIFRAIHTIKGTCAFINLSTLERLTHTGENLLARVRDKEVTYDARIASALLALIDRVKQLLELVEHTGEDAGVDCDDVIALLSALNEESASAPGAAKTAAPQHAAQPAKVEAARAAPVAAAATVEPVETRSQAVVAEDEEAEAHVETAVRVSPEAPAGEERKKNGSSGGEHSSVRVDVELLDGLMDLVGELVLARNQLLELTSDQRRTPIAVACQRIDLITTDLQERMLKTRMQPISRVWNKMPRVARDIARQCGKGTVRLETEGAETELDKTLIEAISEPLSHLIRNCVDHGIERPEVRRAAGKPEEGCVTLRAYHESGQIVVEICDDGGGINVDRVRRKAVERGLLTEEAANRLGQREVLNLIFLPGFSTAEAVTNISGRGVGMDVVRTNIERVGGSIEILTEAGQGTTFRIRIPLTLAIVHAIIVRSAGQRFAIPQLGVQEMIRITRENGRFANVEELYGARVYRLRGNLLPLVSLDELLGIRDVSGTANQRDVAHIVTLHVEGRTFGLVVDEIANSEEIVVKPPGSVIASAGIYAGTTILGDGRVALILDAASLAARAGLKSQLQRNAMQAIAESVATADDSRSAFVLCAGSDGSRIAVPLSAVERLETIASSSIELSDGRFVTQYRGEIVPLFGLQSTVGSGDSEIHMLVHRRNARRTGVIVTKILDVVEETVRPHGGEAAGDVTATAVIHGRVTDVIDLDAWIERRTADVPSYASF